jgi:hypothetical protein
MNLRLGSALRTIPLAIYLANLRLVLGLQR